ncbi:Diaminopimelate epimerase-like protein [Suillus weaverae]|nr:Diaminopimelate epimerase-like protein [Suillus weaverae]
MSTFPYVIINAFTRTPFGGNPAVIIALPPSSLSQPQTFSDETMIKISLAFAQPMSVFLSLSPDDSTLLDVRFYNGTHAPLICGHGMFAAVKALCTNALPSLGQLGPEVKLRMKTGTIISAYSVTESGSEEEKYEIALPATPVVTIPDVETERIASVLSEAAGRNVQVEYVAKGEGKMGNYLMIVIGQDENIGDMKLHIDVLRKTSYGINIITNVTPDADQVFVSRMFAPAEGLPEDHVCGSAHTLLVPYWASRLGKKNQEEIYVRQVSPRGGELWVTWDQDKGLVRLKGHAKAFGKGDFTI